MEWEVEFTDEFGEWWDSLSTEEQVSVADSVLRLREAGPILQFPHSSGVKGSKHTHMRELRTQHAGRPYRTLYAFDPRRAAILLIGDKTGNDRWYEVYVTIADKRVSQKGFLHGLTMLANYTWSKAIDTLPVSAGVENTGVSTIPFWSPGRRAFDTGRSDFDHRHRMVVSYNMPLSRFSGSNALVKGVFGSWELSGVFTVQSADALTITSGRDQSLTGIGQGRAVVLGPALRFGSLRFTRAVRGFL